MMIPNHQHLLVRAFCLHAPRDNADELNQWLSELVVDIDMKEVFPPRSVFVDVEGNRGLTGSVNVETSHIAIHIWIEQTPNLVQLDVYSCKAFNPDTVIQKLQEWKLVSADVMNIDRNDGIKVISNDHLQI